VAVSTRPKDRPKQDFMKRADKAFSLFIRARDGGCMAAGAMGVTCSGNLQCCHIIGRGELSIRVNPLNAIAMCQAHHMFFTPRIATWHDFVDIRFPGRWDELRGLVREHRESMRKVDWRAELESLRTVMESR
jgi:hypothetical protein